MGKVISMRRSWGRVTSPRDAYALIDRGIVLQRKDVRRVLSRFDATEQKAVIEHFAITFYKNSASWSMAERTIESLLVWLTWANNYKAAHVFIAKLCEQEDFRKACWALTEVALFRRNQPNRGWRADFGH